MTVRLNAISMYSVSQAYGVSSLYHYLSCLRTGVSDDS